MNKKVLSTLLVVTMGLSMVLAGCGGTNNTASPSGAATVSPPASPSASASDATSTADASVVMVTDVGGVNDESFNQSAWEGLKKAKDDLGLKDVSYIESKQAGDYAPNLEQALGKNADIIWGVGFMMQESMLQAAQNNPNQKYAVVDVAYDEGTQPDNLVTVNFKAEEGSFLVGYIAAKTSKTNKIGFVGGVDNALINAFEYGYYAGAKTANKDIEIVSQYVESFNDSALGKAAAQQMFKDGCDVVYHAAGQSGVGVIEAAKEQGEGKWAIGVDKDQNSLAPDSVLTSAMKNVGTGMYLVVEDYIKNGNFPGGKNITYGLKEDGVGIAPTSDKNVAADVLTEVKGVEDKIKNGEITVPATKDDLDAYVKGL